MNVRLGWELLDCGAAKSLVGAEFAAMLTQACQKRRRKVGDERKAEALEENCHFRGIGKQVITSFIKLQVLGALGGQDVHYAPSITDVSKPSVANSQVLLWEGSSVHLYPGDCWRKNPVERNQGKVDGDDVKLRVGEHG